MNGTNLARAFPLAGINPDVDSIATTVFKFRQHNMRHLLVRTGSGALLLLCSDPEMSREIMDAVHRIDMEPEDEQE